MKPCCQCGYDMPVITECRSYPYDDDVSEVLARAVVCPGCGAQGPWCNSIADAMQAWEQEAERE